ncbi:hypothetical protein O7621_28115 [Solwaraspora sp. WMMD937]|uniref:polysaccharide biosynthesis tyrosine autokinase n=1 Tax=Solwaraspora sp. WMMD937 TaxID=3016090 RepID=UPI00249A217A|nr:polysaccharide biosynthesis tyrosine autokinase [Solwaraspora sp. WMMD937]WFE21638.1 hypothetical protein O7621_28115 [Solwaraspora sp. WMMD937]
MRFSVKLSERFAPARLLSRPASDGPGDGAPSVHQQWQQLTLERQLRAVWSQRWLVLALVLLGGAGAGLASAQQEPMYRADAQLFFAPNFTTRDIGQLNEGGNYILQRVRSYAEVGNSPEVAEAVVRRLGLPYQPSELTQRVTVTGAAGTAVLTVEVRDPDPVRARDIADAIAAEFPAYVARLEKPTGIDESPVKVSVTRPATTPSAPATPRVTADTGLGAAGGLAIGVLFAVVRYARDRTVRDESHAAEVAGTVLLGAVAAGGGRPPLATGDDTEPRVEAFRQIRANLLLRAAGSRFASLTVTGSVPGEERTATAANIAIAFARAGEPVVLVDADVRHPGVHRLFDVPNTVGLTSVLRGEVAAEQATHRHPDLPLYVLPAGPAGPGPSEQLLASDALAPALESMRLGGRFVVVDAPSLLSDAETLLLASVTDATLLVARVGFTRADRLAVAADVLRALPVNLVGLVATRRGAATRRGRSAVPGRRHSRVR